MTPLKYKSIKLIAFLYFLYILLTRKDLFNSVFEMFGITISIQFLLIILCLIPILFVSMTYISRLTKEKRYLNNFTIITQYQPPSNIHPAIAGMLIDKNIGKREFFATLFNLIINGNIAIDEKIINGKYKYSLIKNKSFKSSISCDRLISASLFKNKDSVPFERITFQTDLPITFIRDELVKLNYFEDSYCNKYDNKLSDRNILKTKWIESIERASNRFSFLLTKKEKVINQKRVNKDIKIINELFSRDNLKPLKKLKKGFSNDTLLYTKLGAEERVKWLGFKDYLQTAERFRLDEEKVETFSKYLPYAIALGVETEWAKRFENMDINRLEWFRSQKSESIRRHNSQKVYFKHLINFLGQIYVKQ